MFGIGWDVLHAKGNIIIPIVFIPSKKNQKTPWYKYKRQLI